MPYYGLLDKDGNEVHGGGYHRLDASNAHFKISPPSVRKSDHLTFVNVEDIVWSSSPATDGSWRVESLALFDEADSQVPLVISPLSSHHVCAGDTLVISPGLIRIGWKGNYYDPDEPEAETPKADEGMHIGIYERENAELCRLNHLLRITNDELRAENKSLRAELAKIKS